MEKRSSQLSPRRLRHWLYLLASLPVILFAALWFFGAFNQPSTKPAPSPSPSATASPQNHEAANPAGPTDPAERLDTAPHHPPGKNAADFYKQAWGLYKQLNLTDEEKKMLRDRGGKWDKEKAKALFEKIQPVVEMMRQSEGSAYADWGIEMKKFSDKIPQITAAFDLGTLMAWSSAYEFASNSQQALADLDLQMQIGKSVGRNLMIGLLVNAASNRMAIETLRNNSSLLSSDEIGQALQMFQGAPLTDSLPTVMEQEAQLARNEADMISTGSEPIPPPGITLESAQLNEFYKNNIPAAMSEIQLAAQLGEQFAQKALLPDAEFESWWQEIQQSTANNKPLTYTILQGMPAFRTNVLKDAVQTTMFQAGLSILQKGAPALGSYLDPITEQPFTLVPTADGFELQSTFQYHGKPVVMPFPTAKP